MHAPVVAPSVLTQFPFPVIVCVWGDASLSKARDAAQPAPAHARLLNTNYWAVVAPAEGHVEARTLKGAWLVFNMERVPEWSPAPLLEHVRRATTHALELVAIAPPEELGESVHVWSRERKDARAGELLRRMTGSAEAADKLAESYVAWLDFDF